MTDAEFRAFVDQARAGQLVLFLALASLAVTACHRGRWDDLEPGTGDAGQFILHHAIACGARPLRTTELPVVADSWRYSQDDAGVVMRLGRNDYEAVQSFLRAAFGEPRYGPNVTTDGGQLGGYRLSEKGGAIQFGYDGEGTQVIVICIKRATPPPGGRAS